MKSQSGFTILEFAVVSVIIGFIIAGIFGAQTLVRASQLHNMLAEYDSHVKAVNEFRDKFLQLPGDMPNAESMWGTDAGGCPNTPSDTTPKVATCNGDGNGSIGSSDTSAVLSNTNEWFRAWQQMYNAGFTHTKLTGTPGSGSAQEAVVGQNVPASGITGAGWSLLYYLQLATTASLWGDQYGHIMTLGRSTANSFTASPVLSAGEALAVDQKIDDGKPGKGVVRAWRTAVQSDCTSNDTSQTNHTYNAVNTGVQSCSLIFLLGF